MNRLQLTLFAYGVLNIVGGFMGYRMAGSTMSLIVGGGAGLAILFLTSKTNSNPGFAYRSLAVIVLALAGFWLYRIFEVRNLGKSPAQAIVYLVLALAVFAYMGAGHMMATRRHRTAG